jgi:hypothetical protein
VAAVRRFSLQKRRVCTAVNHKEFPGRTLRLDRGVLLSPRPSLRTRRGEPQRKDAHDRRRTRPLKSPAGPHLRGFSSNASITHLSPAGSTPLGQKTLTWLYTVTLDRPGHPKTASTTCATWYPVRDPGSGREPFPARQSGIAGCSTVSHSRLRPSHLSRNLTRRGKPAALAGDSASSWLARSPSPCGAKLRPGRSKA